MGISQAADPAPADPAPADPGTITNATPEDVQAGLTAAASEIASLRAERDQLRADCEANQSVIRRLSADLAGRESEIAALQRTANSATAQAQAQAARQVAASGLPPIDFAGGAQATEDAAEKTRAEYAKIPVNALDERGRSKRRLFREAHPEVWPDELSSVS